ncbi:hypothetical protein TGS27_0451 [Geobacillus stearothermophilus]|nr:hypothetical protein TGS27_0451 [Geobacillus stearothermophilus]
MKRSRSRFFFIIPPSRFIIRRKKRIDSLAIVRYDFVNEQKKEVYIWSDGLRFDRLT